jgi:hypothetical protein
MNAAAQAVQKRTRMTDATNTRIRILLVRPWTQPIAPIRTALRDGGIDAHISRVDIEPALDAALSRRPYDVIVFDPSSQELTLDVVHTRAREHGHVTPIIVLGSIEQLASLIKHTLLANLN